MMTKEELALTKENENIIKAARASTGRSCGECSMCCKLLDIDEVELKKPAGKWCSHCRPGAGGCTIYNARPPVCRSFGCMWLVDSTLSDEWKPSRSKIVLHVKIEDGSIQSSDGTEQEALLFRFVVDPATPDRWRQKPFYQDIKATALNGLIGGGWRSIPYETSVEVGKRMWIITPDEDVEITDNPAHMILPIGPYRWKVLTFKNRDEAARVFKLTQKFSELMVTAPRD